MTLRSLMDNAFDETWFCVVAPDKTEYKFWNADYIGGHESVMPDLNPLLDMEFEDFQLITILDPEDQDIDNAEMVPAVYVELEESCDDPCSDGDQEKSYVKDDVIMPGEIANSPCSFWKEESYVRSVVPYKYAVIYKGSGQYFAVMRSARALSNIVNNDMCSDGEHEVMIIPNDDIELVVMKLIQGGMGVAMTRFRKDGRHEVYAIIDESNEIGRINKDNENEDE